MQKTSKKANKLDGSCRGCGKDIGVNLFENDEKWAQKHLKDHVFVCPYCGYKSESFIEGVFFKWSKNSIEHIITMTEKRQKMIILCGKQFEKAYPLLINMPKKIIVYIRKKAHKCVLGKYLSYKKFVFKHPYVKKFKKNTLIGMEVNRDNIRIRKIY